MSVADFARRVKLEEAIRLMCEESKNITETAFSLGFSSTQYFATIFKKYFGCAPNQFKAKSQK
jgi:AraC-like DNA-binding protein